MPEFPALSVLRVKSGVGTAAVGFRNRGRNRFSFPKVAGLCMAALPWDLGQAGVGEKQPAASLW